MFTRIASTTLCLAGILLAAPVGSANAVAWQPQETIRAAVHDHLAEQASAQWGSDVQIAVRPLDPRLRLAACSSPLQILPSNRPPLGAVTLGVRCAGTESWTIYVSARLSAFVPVLAATRPLARGTRLTAADLDAVRLDVSTLPQGYLPVGTDLVGKVVRQPIAAGLPLRPAQVEEPKLIRRGEQITLRAARDGFEVSMAGLALADGRVGERISVRNSASGRVVEGKVVAEGMVDVAH